MIALDNLASVPIFLRWKLEPNEKGALTKVPYSPHGMGKASHATRSHWGTLAEASASLEKWGGDGLGIVAAAVDDQHVHACLDVDGCYPPGSDQRSAWVNPVAAILKGCYRELSWSGAGEHFHFLVRREVATKRRWRINAKRPSADGMKDHGFELAVSLDGGYYLTCTRKGEGELRVVEEFELQALYDSIAAFRPESRKQRKARTGRASPNPDSHARTLAAIAALDNDGRFADRGAWCVIGMAVHDGTGGSDAGLRAWTAWTERLHADAENACARAWATFTPGGGTTVATLFKYARENGFEPRRRNGHDQAETGQPQVTTTPAESDALGNEFFFDGFVVDDFVNTFANSFRHVHRWGQWLLWDGRRWQAEQTQLVRSLLADITARMAEQYGKRVTGGRIDAIERLAQTQRAFARAPDIWDADPFLLNTESCVADLSTGDDHTHDPAENLTKLAGAGVGTAGGCARWQGFLDKVTGGDLALQAYLQRMAGYCLTGSTREHCFFFAYGTGRNGKTTFVEVLSGLLGSYARNMPAETFMETKHERHPTELAAMQGYRLITATEVKRGARWHETRIKELTGGDTISARYMRQDFFEYKPQFKLLVSGNNKPSLRSVDTGMRARLHLLPFTVRIPKAERIKDLAAQLLAEERHAILKWALAGCRDWIAEGLNPPDAVRAATNDYFETMDVVGRWVGERCELGKAFHAATGELFADWKTWCEANGEYAGSQKSFGQMLESSGFTPRKIAHVRSYIGLRLAGSTTGELPL